MFKIVLARHLGLILVTGLFLISLSACDNTTPQIAQVSEDASVWRVQPEVWAGPDEPLPKLSSNAEATVTSGSLIQTDSSGIAKVKFQNCEFVYLYNDSTLSKGTCAPDSQGSGNWVCNGAAEISCQSKLVIYTPSAKIQLTGTRIMVMYLPDQNLTILQVLEGKVDAWPLLAASTSPEDPANLGNLQIVDSNFFWFTAPGDPPLSIDRFQSRQIYEFTEWQPFKTAMINIFPSAAPHLDHWLGQLKQRSIDEGLTFPRELLVVNAGPVLNGGGPLLNRDDIEAAILSAVDWKQWMTKTYSQDTLLSVTFPSRQLSDARSVTYDLAASRKIILSAGLKPAPENTLILLVPTYNQEFESANQQLVRILQATGLVVEVVQVSPIELDAKVQSYLQAGQSVLWISQP